MSAPARSSRCRRPAAAACRCALPAALLLAAAILGRPGPAAALPADEIREAYRGVLAVLASGDEERALDELFAFETDALGKEPWRRIEQFWRLKLRVIRDLLDVQPIELLVPIIVLHHDAYLRYRDADRPTLAAHSRTMASELAEIYADRTSTSEARRFSAWVMSSFGAYLQESRSISSSAEFFLRAVNSDPTNDAALVALAAAYEKSAEYEAAILQLERAVRVNPGNHHARVRLAVCLARRGPAGHDAAVRQLERAVKADSSPDWVRSIAHQELARLRLAGGDDKAAEAVLRQGLERLPGDQQLIIQLAALLDAGRRRREAVRVLEGLTADRWSTDSPRLIYDTLPAEGIAETRQAMHQLMQSRLPSLQASLSGAGGVSGR